MNPRTLLRKTALLFQEAGIPDPETDSALILSFLCNRPPLELRIDSDTVLSDAILQKYDKLASERIRRIPLQYLLSEAPFLGRTFHVDPRVLIPRPETELLCLWAMEKLRGMSGRKALDLCCGSGCIGLTIKAELPDVDMTLSDISSDALTVSDLNAVKLQLDVKTCQGDLLSAFPAHSFDLIVCNPPYIPTGVCSSLQPEVMFEPRTALDGGKDGLDFYRRLIPDAGQVLNSCGFLIMELGSGESDPVSSLLDRAGFSEIEIRRDLNGIDRMILACKS